jgi:glucokinase
VSEGIRAIAIDVGGSHAACAVVDEHRVLAVEHFPIPDVSCLETLLPHLAATTRVVLERCGLTTLDCAGLAVSFPGIVDPFSGCIFSTPKGKYDDSSKVDLPLWSRECFGLPLRIENDARMALLGERQRGAARGFDDVVMLTLGTGVGAAAMMHGRLLRGKHFQACLGGHFPVRFDGRPCICGSAGCVETEASTWALPAICHAWAGFTGSALADEPVLDFAALFRCSLTGDRVACAVRNHCLSVWATGSVAMVHAYDPELLVFGGAVMKSSDQILPFLEAYVHSHAWSPWGKTKLSKAELGVESSLLGAVPLLKETCE